MWWEQSTLTGFEPATVGFEVQRAIQLRHKVNWIDDTLYTLYVTECHDSVTVWEEKKADCEIRTRDPLLTKQMQ